jgi:aryl-alcohol dehydrogenase-like predicted oxidoreductase
MPLPNVEMPSSGGSAIAPAVSSPRLTRFAQHRRPDLFAPLTTDENGSPARFVVNFLQLWLYRFSALFHPSTMTPRFFGKSGKHVSEIGLGCWQLGGADWGNLDDAAAFEILNAAADAGVTFLDTADVYGMGRSEELIGRFLKQRGGEFFVATKLGRMPDLYPAGYTEAGVRAATEASLKRLGVEALDLTQLHCVPPAVLQQGDIFEWLRTLRDEGKIRQFGASVESIAEARVCLAQEGLNSLQIIFNLFRQKPAEIFAECQEKQVGVIVRLPLASGLLAGKMTKDQQFAANDHRLYNRDGQAFNVGETFSGLPFEKGIDLVERIRPLVPEGMSMAEMAQRWILDHPAVSTVITGASRPAQAQANAAVSALPSLDPALMAKLAEIYDKEVAPHIRGEV